MKKFKVGYTAGVFDMFHIGHLNILKRAKQECDHLIVAVSTDELSEQYKGKRPVIPFLDRVEIIRAVKYVDEVVTQESRDKIGAYKKYGFDAMFVGDDWKGDPLFEEVDQYMRERGGQVVYLPRTEGVSSQMLIEKREENR
jgi:glycerol-3-phosphate cytidylyltransferase